MSVPRIQHLYCLSITAEHILLIQEKLALVPILSQMISILTAQSKIRVSFIVSGMGRMRRSKKTKDNTEMFRLKKALVN